MSLLADGKVERIELGEGDWIDIIVSLPVKEACQISEMSEKGLAEGAVGILAQVIKAWSEPVPVTPENIERLDVAVAKAVVERFNQIVNAEPKNS